MGQIENKKEYLNGTVSTITLTEDGFKVHPAKRWQVEPFLLPPCGLQGPHILSGSEGATWCLSSWDVFCLQEEGTPPSRDIIFMPVSQLRLQKAIH